MAFDPSELDRERLVRAATLLTRATALHKAGALRSALDPLEEVLGILRGFGDREKEAQVLHFTGLVHYDLEESAKAVICYDQALAIRREFGYDGEGATLFNLGLAHEDLNHLKRACQYYRKALAIFREAGDHDGLETAREALGEAAKELNRTGVAFYKAGKLRRAASTFKEACQFARDAEIGDKEFSLMLKNTGDAYHDLAQFDKALQCYQEARAIRERCADLRGEGEALHHIGAVYQNLGNLQEALGYFHKALDRRRKAGDRPGEEATLNNIGLVYHILGDTDKALRIYEECLAIVRDLGNRASEATTLNNIGGAYNEMGRLDEALRYYQESILIRREIGDRRGEIHTHGNLSAIYDRLGQPEQAFSSAREALRIAKETNNPRYEASALHSLGATFMLQEKSSEALACFDEALAIRRKLGVRQDEAATLTNLAVLYEALGHSDEATTHLEQAVQIIEGKRSELLDDEMRSSYFTTMQHIYRLQVSLSVKKGQIAPAFHAAEQGKARALMDLLAEAHADIRQGLDPVLREEEQRLLLAQSTLRQKLKNPPVSTDEQQDPLLIAQLEHQQRELERAYQINQAEIRRRSPRYAALTQPETWKLDRIQGELLDENTALLEYVLSEQACFLFVVLNEVVQVFVLPPRDEIETKARELRKAVISDQQRSLPGFEMYDQNRYPHAFELYQALIKPAEDLIRHKQLLIVADGELHYLPFALLLTEPPKPSLGGQDAEAPNTTAESTSVTSDSRKKAALTFADLPFLIRRHSIVYSPSASVAGFLKQEHRKQARSWRQSLAAFADPLVPEENQDAFPLLPNSRYEIASIASLIEESPRLYPVENGQADSYDGQSIILRLGNQATKDTVLARFNPQTDPQPTRFVHFATHSLLDDMRPQFSGLLFSPGSDGNSFWHTFEIFNARIPADLVVLSGCETALGKMVGGEGLVGLTRAFFYAGTTSICASLWMVKDRSTKDFMTSFYRHLLNDVREDGFPVDKAEALRQAQLDSINVAGKAAHPFYWAPFTLIGNPN
jgi:CHAT domain-containing protein/Tfp pilus assembly protein PilF